MRTGTSIGRGPSAFARKLLTEPHDHLNLGQWIERKRIARRLQEMIGEEMEAWEPWEESCLRNCRLHRNLPVKFAQGALASAGALVFSPEANAKV